MNDILSREQKDFIKESNELHDKIRNHDLSQPAFIIPYTIEEALDYLKDKEGNKIQYKFKKKKYLLRYNEDGGYFEYSELENRGWIICEYSYMRMKTWKDIEVYRNKKKKKAKRFSKTFQALEWLVKNRDKEIIFRFKDEDNDNLMRYRFNDITEEFEYRGMFFYNAEKKWTSWGKDEDNVFKCPNCWLNIEEYRNETS